MDDGPDTRPVSRAISIFLASGTTLLGVSDEAGSRSWFLAWAIRTHGESFAWSLVDWDRLVAPRLTRWLEIKATWRDVLFP